MHYRNQNDGEQRTHSKACAIDCSDLPDQARQEFKQEADVNWILKRFGIDQLSQRRMTFQVVDYDLDLQQAFALRDATRAGYEKLPAHLREKYGSVQEVLDAIDGGELTTLEPPKPPDPAVPGTEKASTSGDA